MIEFVEGSCDYKQSAVLAAGAHGRDVSSTEAPPTVPSKLVSQCLQGAHNGSGANAELAA